MSCCGISMQCGFYSGSCLCSFGFASVEVWLGSAALVTHCIPQSLVNVSSLLFLVSFCLQALHLSHRLVPGLLGDFSLLAVKVSCS